MPRLRPSPRLVREAAEYLTDITGLQPGLCAVCGNVGSGLEPLLRFTPKHDRSVLIELHAGCQPVWYQRRGGRYIYTPPAPAPTQATVAHMPPPRRRAVFAGLRSQTIPPNDAA
jgi:hypothetical protein